MQYLLDTSICIFFLLGKLNFDDIIREKGLENCFISEITVFELKYGAENSDNPKKSHKVVDKFVKGLTIIPIFGIVDQYAHKVTDNIKDFRHIKNLKLENWAERK